MSKTIKIEIFTLAFLLLSQYGYTQNKTDTTTPDISVVSLKKLTVNVLGIEAGFGYEMKIGRTSTVSFFGGCLIGRSTDRYINFKAPLIAAPVLYIEYRNYYNLNKSARENKRIRHNSENFFLFKTETVFPISNQNYYNIYVSQGWGLSRPILKRLNVDIALGVTEHFILNDNHNHIIYSPNFKLEPLFKLEVGYLL